MLSYYFLLCIRHEWSECSNPLIRKAGSHSPTSCLITNAKLSSYKEAWGVSAGWKPYSAKNNVEQCEYPRCWHRLSCIFATHVCNRNFEWSTQKTLIPTVIHNRFLIHYVQRITTVICRANSIVRARRDQSENESESWNQNKIQSEYIVTM